MSRFKLFEIAMYGIAYLHYLAWAISKICLALLLWNGDKFWGRPVVMGEIVAFLSIYYLKYQYKKTRKKLLNTLTTKMFEPSDYN